MNRYIFLAGTCLLLCIGCGRSSTSRAVVAEGRNAVVEAEQTHKSVNVGSHYWKVATKQKETPAHLIAFPSDNKGYDPDDAETTSPGVEYPVMFNHPGTFYLWVKGRGEAGGASVIPGIDGTPLAHNADFMGFFPGEFSWLGGLHNSGKRTVLQIDMSGEHRINFWMLEDGFRFDKFLITTDANFIPN